MATTKTFYLKNIGGYYGGVKAFNNINKVSRTTVITEDGKQVTNKTENVEPDSYYSGCSDFAGYFRRLTGVSIPRSGYLKVDITTTPVASAPKKASKKAKK